MLNTDICRKNIRAWAKKDNLLTKDNLWIKRSAKNDSNSML